MAKHQPKQWKFRPGERDQAQIVDLVKSAGISYVLARQLCARGVETVDGVREYLSPSLWHLHEPNRLPGCARAAALLWNAVVNKQKIAIYGDYDVDGMTATAILVRCLKQECADVIYYIPHRVEDGYGLRCDAIKELAQRGVKCLITVDCGITAVEEVALAKELGLTVIITDHHQPGRNLPEADALVHADLFSHSQYADNPAFIPLDNDLFLKRHAVSATSESEKQKKINSPEEPQTQKPVIQVRYPDLTHPYPFTGLSGAGVACKVAWAFCQRAVNSPLLGPRRRAFILDAITLAAVGTVADVVSLKGENRSLVAMGLALMEKQPSVGLSALMDVCKRSNGGSPNITSEFIGYSLAPRLNAAGRLEQSRLGVDLLITEDPDQAAALAEHLNTLNEMRKSLEEGMTISAGKMIKKMYPDPEFPPGALVLANPDWHRGVIGIVAGKVAEKHRCPTIIISLNKVPTEEGTVGTGSARSTSYYPDFNLYEALSTCEPWLLRFGGHACAAGLQVTEKNLGPFRDAFTDAVLKQTREMPAIPVLWVDGHEMFMTFTLDVVRDLERLGPFGQDNQAPVFCTLNVLLDSAPRIIGREAQNPNVPPRHLRLQLRQHGRVYGVTALGWGDDYEEFLDLFQKNIPLDVVYRVESNFFQGQCSVSFKLVDWRITEKIKKSA